MFLNKLHDIRGFVFDVDGVLTDGTVHVTESGEQLRKFSIKDGYALQLAVKRGYPVAVISGARSQGVRLRLQGLGITQVFLAIENKTDTFHAFLDEYGLSPDQIVYMGDDVPDLPVMKLAGLAVCPADAADDIKAIAHYISPRSGGQGCARDIIEKVLKVQNRWFDENPSAHDGSLG